MTPDDRYSLVGVEWGLLDDPGFSREQGVAIRFLARRAPKSIIWLAIGDVAADWKAGAFSPDDLVKAQRLIERMMDDYRVHCFAPAPGSDIDPS